MGFVRKWFFGVAVLIVAHTAICQTSAPASSEKAVADRQVSGRASGPSSFSVKSESQNWLAPGADPNNRLMSPFVKHLAQDQKQFWSAPTRLRVEDLKWIAPSASLIAAFVATDSWWAKQVPASHVDMSNKFSAYAAYSLVGLGGASYLLGHIKHDDHLSEAGLLAGEAAINSTAVTYLFKEATQRERPNQGNGHGNFLAGGASFPSEHSAIAWSIASVWAHEYPGWFSQSVAYGLASAVTLTRVTAKQHFPSDAIVGSALGWYFGRQVYRAHHDPELGGSGWGDLLEEKTGERTRNPNHMASPYVPLDSWIYPELERLIALGYVRSNMLGMRPWTRLACAHVLEDGNDKFSDDGVEEGEAGNIYKVLTAEFATELARLDGSANVGARLESIYTRMTGISGTPIRDGYHFGQTIINDYGRPYWEGFNNATGMTADAELGPVSFSFRGEYQHAPAMPSESPQTLAAVAHADLTPTLPNGTGEANQFVLLDSMAAVNAGNVQISFGKQSAWFGPGESGSLLLSDNSAPFPMLRIDDIVPHKIPGPLGVLGPFRAEFFVGQLSGQHWEFCTLPNVPVCHSNLQNPGIIGPNISPQPFFHGEKISFQPTPNLEFGMGVTALFGGPGLPVTFGNFFKTYYVHTPANNPGKRVSSADFSYRVPGLRNWLTFYLDSMTWDEFSPIGSTRANVNPGIYLPRIPKIRKLELRAEGVNISRTREFFPGFVYFNADRYRSGYTNDGYLLASWIGRAGRGGQGWLTYWFSPRNKLQAGYRLQTVSPTFIEGGRLVDYSVQSEFMVGGNLSISGLVQYEQWRFPIISPTRQSDVTAALQMTFYPHWHLGR
jgi:membrane-associated phospholipid phosphatase